MASKLTLIDTKPGSPPRPLLRHGQALWNRIKNDYVIDDACGVELLTLCGQALDRAEDCKALIDACTEEEINKAMALMKIELANRAFVSKQLERLGVNEEPAKLNGRPAGSWSGYAKASKSPA